MVLDGLNIQSIDCAHGSLWLIDHFGFKIKVNKYNGQMEVIPSHLPSTAAVHVLPCMLIAEQSALTADFIRWLIKTVIFA